MTWYTDLMSTSFFHEDLVVTNLQNFTRCKFILDRSKALTHTRQGGGSRVGGIGGVLFDQVLTLILNNFFSHKTFSCNLQYPPNIYLEIWRHLEGWVLKKNLLKKKLTIKIYAIYGLVLDITDVIKNM